MKCSRRSDTPSNYERGAKFEKLMTQYLPLDPVYGGACSSTCGCGRNGPAAPARPTSGIDLVAQEVDTGDLWAIQCKFYEPVHTLSKPASTRFCPRL